MDELVERLSVGEHPIVAGRYKSAEELKQGIERGYVLLKFTDTQGGTELGVRLDQTAAEREAMAPSAPSGSVRLAGQLVLNYVKVRCVAEVDLATLEGKGHLEIAE